MHAASGNVLNAGLRSILIAIVVRMTVSYHRRGTALLPTYYCHRLGQRLAEPTCQNIDGAAIDAAIGALLVATVTPLAIEVALAVQQEIRRGSTRRIACAASRPTWGCTALGLSSFGSHGCFPCCRRGDCAMLPAPSGARRTGGPPCVRSCSSACPRHARRCPSPNRHRPPRSRRHRADGRWSGAPRRPSLTGSQSGSPAWTRCRATDPAALRWLVREEWATMGIPVTVTWCGPWSDVWQRDIGGELLKNRGQIQCPGVYTWVRTGTPDRPTNVGSTTDTFWNRWHGHHDIFYSGRLHPVSPSGY